MRLPPSIGASQARRLGGGPRSGRRWVIGCGSFTFGSLRGLTGVAAIGAAGTGFPAVGAAGVTGVAGEVAGVGLVVDL